MRDECVNGSTGTLNIQKCTYVHFRLTLRPHVRRTGREEFSSPFDVVLERFILVLSVLCNKSIVLAEMKCGELPRNVSSDAGVAGHLKGHR